LLTYLITYFFNHGPNNTPLQTTTKKSGKARGDSMIIEVHNGRGSTMEEMALAACMFSVCMNWIRYGKNHE
jgi:hypothetical protein